MPSKAGCAKEQTHPTVWYIINARIAATFCHLIDRTVDNRTHNEECDSQHHCYYQWNKNLLAYTLFHYYYNTRNIKILSYTHPILVLLFRVHHLTRRPIPVHKNIQPF